MKHINKFIATALLTISLIGCSNILEEQPRSNGVPALFNTEQGVMGGLTALYAQLRYVYGNGYWMGACQVGTDESTYGGNSDANTKVLDFTGQGVLSPTTSRGDVLWNNSYQYINTASGIIENATAMGSISAALIAEARFFRAFDYFQLVQVFGGVPLDLGAGELKFNTSKVRNSVRNTVPEVYTKAVFPDLLMAINDLPATPRLTGTATKTLARLILAKAYLTYAWWLENPNNIPSYPVYTTGVARIDPDNHDATWYYQQAYNIAIDAIQNPGSAGLVSTFYDLVVATNDRNKECLLYADHTEKSEIQNGSNLSYSSGGDQDYFAGWFQQFNYTLIRSATSSINTSGNLVYSWGTSSVQREASQDLGRPWTMIAPPNKVLTNTFSNKSMDSRYDATFVTVYRGNWKKGGVANDSLYNANFRFVGMNQPILSFINDTTGVDYTSSNAKKNSVGAGWLPTRSDFVLELSRTNRTIYPGNYKLGSYRTDNGTGLGTPNGANTRPFNIAKFSELFFVAAEAAVKGATVKTLTGAYANDGTARGLINVIRARAGKWSWNHAMNVAVSKDNSAAMVAATPANITIDYILEERTREYFGEGYRWFDLVRTQKLVEYAGSYTIVPTTSASDFTWKAPKTFTRTILPEHYLRPIPQGQIDAMEMTAEERLAYQNPGYR